MTKFQRLCALGCALGLMISSTTFADNGLYQIGFGAKSKAMGGAAVAYAQDTFGAMANPAGLADMDDRVDVAAGYVYHTQEAALTNLSPILISFGERNARYPMNGSRHAFFGEIGFSHRFNDCLIAAILITPQAGGINKIQSPIPPINPPAFPLLTHQKEKVFYAAITPCVAFNIFDCVSLGIGVDFTGAAVNFKNFTALTGLVTAAGFATHNTTLYPHHVTDKGWDYGWGAAVRLGALWHAHPWISVGASYRSKTFMSRFKRYAGLITPQGRADLPEILSAGIAIKAIPRTVIAFDIARIFNHRVPAFGNPPAQIAIDLNTFQATVLNPHGANNGAAFGWKNQTVYKVGVSYDFGGFDWCWCDNIILRAGYNYGKCPIPIVNDGAPFIPSVIEHHLTLGGTWNFSPCTELSFAWIHGFKHTFHGRAVPLQPAAVEALLQAGKAKSPVTAKSDQVEIQLSWLF